MRIPSCLDDDDEEEEDELDENEDEDGELCTNRNSIKSRPTDGPTLSFTPQQAHIFGGQSIFLSFVNIDAPLNEDIFYYVVFKGSKLQHITSAKVLNPYTLQAVIPDHNDAELVILSVYQYASDTNVLNLDNNIMATDTFVYTSDSSQFLTQQLALNVDNSPSLLNLQNVYSSLLDISMQDKKSLDYKLTASFRNLSLPPNWSLVSKTKKEDERSWTLLHFCAKYNFPLLAEYLLVKPGAQEALKTLDDRDRSPVDIANLTKHKKMIEVLSRTPCEEELPEEGEKEIKRPTVKRHKLGTTTYTNNVSEGEDITVKDLMILKELDALATTSKGPQKNGSIETTDEHYPLAESLKKLHEINEEIRRLRNINLQDDLDHLDEVEDCFGEDMVLKDSIDTCNGEHIVDENMNDTNNLVGVIDIGIEERFECEERPENEEKIGTNELNCDDDSEISGDVNLNILDDDEEKPPKPERQHSNISVNQIEVHVAENVEFICEEPVQVTPVIEVVQNVIKGESISESEADIVTDITDIDNAGESYCKLESVTEETEEELDADGTGRTKFSKLNKKEEAIHATETQSLNELPPLPYKRVGVLRSRSKKDRPLSDSFENLRMIESQGIIDLYNGTYSANAPDGQILHRGHSLDTLTKDLDDGNDTERSTTSVNECHGSQESVSSDSESCASRLRTGSEFFQDHCDSTKSTGIHRTISLLSLNDLCTSRHSSGYIQEEVSKLSKKSSSLLHRLSFKKAKSMTSLDMREKNVSKNDDRRKTITGGVHDDFLVENKYQDSSKDEDYNDSHQGMLYGDIFVHCESYDDQMKLLKSSTSKKASKGSSHHDISDEDTDEGTSHEIGEQHVAERKSSNEDKSKRLFGILRSKNHGHKERKGSKEKKEEKVKERRDSDAKQKKKIATAKQEVAVSSKSDSKSFLPKRGSSFRKPVADSKGSEKSRLMRGSAALGNSNPFNKRSSERKSPSSSAKFNPQIPEVPEGGNDLSEPNLLPLNKNLSSSQASLNSDSLCIDDDTDAPFSPLEEGEYDSDLDKYDEDEPETWSELVDKKVQRKMHAKDIKRQDVIYELIQTESQYVRILQIMKKIYWDGMMRHLHITTEIVNAMFPVLEDLIELNGNFLRDMKKEQENSENYCVKSIGNVILKSFDGENGKLFKEKYGYFCSHHLEAVALYKDFLKNDKKFQQFVKNCLLKSQTRRLSIPECITYVTIRMTKYPLLIEAIIKATKEVNPDFADLKKALHLIKETLVGVDEDVEVHEQQKELDILKKNLDSKNVVEIKNDANKGPLRFKANKLFHKRSRLLYDKKVILKSKNKNYDTRMVILADKIIFFQENGGKLQLLNVDNKMPLLSLKGVMVREVATDLKALFLMNTSKEFIEIYEIVFEKAKEKAEFMPKLEKFIKNCPDEEEENLTDNEEEARREEEDRMRRLRDLIEKLDNANQAIHSQLEIKNKTVQKLIECMEEEIPVKGGSPCNEMKPVDVYNARVQLEVCLLQANSILHSYSTQSNSPASSPGQSNNNSNPQSIPKKSDTFGGFDNRTKPAVVNNISRASSLKPMVRPGLSETDIAHNKNRRQSPLMQVLSRSKTMGSNEDLTSLSSSTSTLSLSNFCPPTLSQLQVYQLLSEGLGSLVKVTNDQDLEIAKMRYELQEARGLQLKTEAEVTILREKLTLQQKDSERQLRNEKDNYDKLYREFKRNKEKNQKLAEQQQRHLKANSEEMIV